jgi:hypothetical protein
MQACGTALPHRGLGERLSMVPSIDVADVHLAGTAGLAVVAAPHELLRDADEVEARFACHQKLPA